MELYSKMSFAQINLRTMIDCSFECAHMMMWESAHQACQPVASWEGGGGEMEGGMRGGRGMEKKNLSFEGVSWVKQIDSI